MESWKKFMQYNTKYTRQPAAANARPLISTRNKRLSTISSIFSLRGGAKFYHARFRKWLGCCWTWTCKSLEKSRRVFDNTSRKTTVECSVTSSQATYHYGSINSVVLENHVKAVIEYCKNSSGLGWDTQMRIFPEINPHHTPNLIDRADVETCRADCEVNKVLGKGFEENCFPTTEEAAVDKHSNVIHEIKTSEMIIAGQRSLRGSMLKEDNEFENVSWEKGEIEWKRTLACKLFEERHNVGRSERMDSLWEAFEIDSNRDLPAAN